MAGLVNDGYEYQERIGRASAGRSVLEHLATAHRHSTEAQWRARLEQGQLSLDGALAHPEVVLREGQRLAWCRPGWEEPAAPLAFEVLHEDRDLLVVAKPRGLPTLPGGGYLTHTLLWQVRRRAPDADPMHRLDRATSGIVLFALTPRARSAVSAAWRAGEVSKLYRALVSGVPASDCFEIEIPIGEVKREGSIAVWGASSIGKRAHSRVTVAARREDRALVDVEITTGRSHQVRIHLAAAGHPLVGDPLYGPGGAPRSLVRPGDGDFLLHARALTFPHPATGARMEIHSPPPPDLG